MNNIVVTGFAGTGKSTVGQHLARVLGRAFVDMDQLIEQRQGRTISAIFAAEGEPFFRRLEAALCHELAGWHGYVIATGGGTMVNATNAAVLSVANLVVCLDCAPEQLWQRLSHKQDRPLLNDADSEQKRARLLALWHERQPAYARLPFHVDTTNRSVAEIVDEIVAMVGTGL